MKKWIVLGAIMLGVCHAQTIYAEEIHAGSFMVSLYGGLSAGLQNSGLNFADKDFAWGNIGGEIGLSGLYFPVEYFGIGADIRYAGFAGSEKEIWDRKGWIYHKHHVDMNMNTFHLMPIARVNLNPHDNFRFYVPFGAGLTVASGQFEYQLDDRHAIDTSVTNASLGYFVGLGMEYDWWGDAASVGFETRYNAFRYDVDRLASRIDADTRPGKKDYSYLSFLITLSFR